LRPPAFAQSADVAAILTITWRELGGPPIAAPVPSGYGSTLICDLIPHELGGTENMKAGNRAIEVVRIRITGAGRDALAGED
jgi:two-component sensor histidine kinase